MKFRSATIAAFVASAMLFFGIPAIAADAQADPLLLAPETVAGAQAVVNADVVATKTVQVGGLPYTIAELSLDETITGHVSGPVHVASPGGAMPDGVQVSVSHAAHLEVGDEVQVALTQASVDVQAAAATVGLDAASVYSVRGDDEGVASLDGADLHGHGAFSGASDYVFNGARWDDFTPSAKYYVNPAGSGVGSGATINAVKRAAATWENDPQSSVDMTYGGTTTRSGVSMTDGKNTISFQNKANEGYLAVAYWMPIGGGQYAFDIIFNTRYRFGDRSGSGNWYDIESTALHEFGHVLGLAHTNATSEVMSSTIVAGTIKGLGTGDRSGIRSLYRAPAGPTCDGKLVTVNLQTGQGSASSGADVILGTSGPDNINGGAGPDTICGNGGNDKIDGGGGDDTIFGGDGSDEIKGGSGNDELNGGDGSDTMYGEQGADSMSGGPGNDRMWGQGSNDTLAGGTGADSLRGGVGNDDIRGGDGEDLLFGNAGSDTIDGGNDADRLRGQANADQLFGRGGDDLVVGGGGADTHNGGPGSDRCVEGASQSHNEAYISCEY